MPTSPDPLRGKMLGSTNFATGTENLTARTSINTPPLFLDSSHHPWYLDFKPPPATSYCNAFLLIVRVFRLELDRFLAPLFTRRPLQIQIRPFRRAHLHQLLRRRCPDTAGRFVIPLPLRSDPGQLQYTARRVVAVEGRAIRLEFSQVVPLLAFAQYRHLHTIPKRYRLPRSAPDLETVESLHFPRYPAETHANGIIASSGVPFKKELRVGILFGTLGRPTRTNSTLLNGIANHVQSKRGPDLP